MTEYLNHFKISRPVKRSIVIAGHKTSFTLEHDFWCVLKRYASIEEKSVSEVIFNIDKYREGPPMLDAGLSCVIRQFLLRDILSRPQCYEGLIESPPNTLPTF